MDDLNLSIVFAQIINFWIIFFIFYHFLWKTIVKVIEDRRSQIDNLDKSDSVVKEKMEEAEKQANELLEKSRKDALQIQQKAEEISKENTYRKIQEAEQKAASILDSAKRDLEKEKLSMMEAMKDKLLSLSLKINSKVFDNNDLSKEFITKEVNSVKL